MSKETSIPLEQPGLYSEYATRHLVFQEKTGVPLENLGRDFHILHSESAAHAPIRSEQETSPNFQYSKEYYEGIKDEKQRMHAYRALEISKYVPEGEDKEIQDNPWQFLYIDQDSNASHVRAAKITLAKLWHPDQMNPTDVKRLETVFKYLPFEYPFEGETYEEWIEELRAFEPKNADEAMKFANFMSSTRSVEDFDAMKPEEREEYIAYHERHQALEDKAEIIRRTMVEVASKKMVIINKAATSALAKLNNTDIHSLGGYEWQELFHYASNLGYSQEPGVKEMLEHLTQRYQDLWLEGDGVMRISDGHFNDKQMNTWRAQPKLSFDHGDMYLMENGYRQELDIRELFAWMDMKLGYELAPSLLDGVTEIYGFDVSTQERLRLMIMNHESPEFIAETLELNEPWMLNIFLQTIYEGPTYSVYDGPQRETTEFPLGIAVSQSGELILSYVHFTNQGFGWGSYEETARFSSSDVTLMRSIAYGPLLQSSYSA